MNWFICPTVIALSYLCGSIPSGYWLVNCLKHIDIRTFGSGSTGATNVWRCAGPLAGITVFVLDFLKGYLPLQIAQAPGLLPLSSEQLPYLLVSMAAAGLVGHAKSMFLGFQGGKSAATGLGTLFALQPLVGLLTFITWLIVLALWRIVSVASIAAVFACIFFMSTVKAPIAYVIYCFCGFLYVAYRHKANIERLIQGTEPRIGKQPASEGKAGPTQLERENLKHGA
jgi:glycerol-3-phosphate acyltransferase PlsY